MLRFACDCGNALFFSSFRCLKCGGEVGYDPGSSTMRRIGGAGGFRRCINGIQHGVCNWLLPPGSSRPLCPACRLNRTIPDLKLGQNAQLWARMEMAKRRLVWSLLRLGITLPTQAENPAAGLAFDIISSRANPEVTTGHLAGVITVNLEEADDTYRQINRQQLGESSRTLLGHFRHESAHYLWHRYLTGLAWDDPLRLAFRHRFGDEWQDYVASLEAHYRDGAPAGWELQYITPYASSHPWEDWAETWQHYLEILDGLETCESLGITVANITVPLTAMSADAGSLPPMLVAPAEADAWFLAWLQRWMCLSTTLNEVAQSIGEPPLYPFVISEPVARKLRLAHHFAGVWGGR